jgi:hypothetical protein
MNAHYNTIWRILWIISRMSDDRWMVLNFCLKHGSLPHIHMWKPYHLYVRYVRNFLCNECAYITTAFIYCVYMRERILLATGIIDNWHEQNVGVWTVEDFIYSLSGDLPNLTWKHAAISSANKYRSALCLSV